MDALTAVTHPDPYPFYAELVAQRPLYKDENLGLWIASSAEAVTAVLTHPAARVRPASEPVPKAIAGTPAGRIFGGLVRMTDGDAHAPMKAAVSATLDCWSPREPAERWARELANTPNFELTIPAYILGTLLGIDDGELPELAAQTSAVAVAMSGGPPADAAAAELLQRFDANTIGFFFQAYYATAGLIALTLLARAREPGRDVSALLEHVLRFDSPVQNTRRFFAADAELLGHTIRKDDAVLVVVAAANRDPRATELFTFGLGPHACPGKLLATTIAEAVVRHADVDQLDLNAPPEYHSHPACRIPRLTLATRDSRFAIRGEGRGAA
jgi:cytochrome P450